MPRALLLLARREQLSSALVTLQRIKLKLYHQESSVVVRESVMAAGKHSCR